MGHHKTSVKAMGKQRVKKMTGSVVVDPELTRWQCFWDWIYNSQEAGILSPQNWFSCRALSATNQEGDSQQIAANGFQRIYIFRFVRCKNKLL
jgi:hypothetical protein